jgi:hypothetical protein
LLGLSRKAKGREQSANRKDEGSLSDY